MPTNTTFNFSGAEILIDNLRIQEIRDFRLSYNVDDLNTNIFDGRGNVLTQKRGNRGAVCEFEIIQYSPSDKALQTYFRVERNSSITKTFEFDYILDGLVHVSATQCSLRQFPNTVNNADADGVWAVWSFNLPIITVDNINS